MSEGKPAPQLALVERTAAAAEQIDRLAGGDEIADPRHDFDHTVNAAGFGDERLEIYCQQDCRGTPMHHDTVGGAELMALRARRISGAAGPRNFR